jgi:hypothetical protein
MNLICIGEIEDSELIPCSTCGKLHYALLLDCAFICPGCIDCSEDDALELPRKEPRG